MIVKFEKEYLEELYRTGKCSDKKHRYQPDVVARYRQRIGVLKDAVSVESLYAIGSYHYEVLKGDKAGISSIRVNDRYRIEFTVNVDDVKPILTVCNILELSNHYK